MEKVNPPQKTGYTIYTKSKCNYCDKVKELFADGSYNGITPLFINCDSFLEEEDTKKNFLIDIEKYVGKPHKTFPMVFKNGLFVGGSEDAEIFFTRCQHFAEEDDDF